MKISDEQLKKVMEMNSVADLISPIELPREKSDLELIDQVTQQVLNMPDRDEMIAGLQAQIAAGTYNPTGDEIIEAMVRRAIADRIR